MSNKIVEYKDLIAFHPGQYVEELIEDYNVTQKEFAERLGVSAKTVSKPSKYFYNSFTINL